MANQYPPTRSQYIDSQRYHAENIGIVLGMMAGVVLLATSTLPINYFTLLAAPAVVGVTALVGKWVMSAVGGLVAEASYNSRYKKTFDNAREMAAAMATDPTLTHTTSPTQDGTPSLADMPEEVLAEPLAVPEEPPRRSWVESLFPHRHRADHGAEFHEFQRRLEDEREMEQETGRWL